MERKNILFCGSGVVDDYKLLDKLKKEYTEKGYNVSIITDCIEHGMSTEDWDHYMFGMIDRTDECLFIVPNTYTLSKRTKVSDNINNYSMTSKHLIYAANQCKKIIWYNEPKDYSTRNFDYSVYTCLHRIAFKYIISYMKIILSEKDYLELINNAVIYHDIDKLMMYQIMNKESAHNYHINDARHHIECKKRKNYYDKLESIIDWECAALSKPDKPLNAMCTLDTYYSDSEIYDELLSIIDSLSIRKPETLTEKDHKEFLEYSQRKIHKTNFGVKFNGKWCITPEYIVNEIKKTHLYHPED